MSNTNTTFQWQVELLRFTFFYPIESDSDVNLWQKITNQLPENKTERPQEGLLIEEGRWEECSLSVSTNVSLMEGMKRIDVVIYSTPLMMPTFPNIGKLDLILKMFTRLEDKLPFDNAIRIAFSTVLLHPEQDISSGYKSLTALLPNIKIEPDSQDFLYQVNVPKKSKLNKSVVINRLRHYSVVSMQVFSMFNTGASPNVQELVATRLELDANTRQDTPLNLSSDLTLKELMKELIDETMDIAEGGDR